jgi:1,4-alpha-glucan branching enzyme
MFTLSISPTPERNPDMRIKTISTGKIVETVKAEPKKETPEPAAKKKATGKHAATFSVSASPGSRVFLAGSFNKWDPTAKEMTDRKGDGVFTATLNLPPGEHQYKFVVDGTWCADPACKESVPNGHGTFNSVVRV